MKLAKKIAAATFGKEFESFTEHGQRYWVVQNDCIKKDKIESIIAAHLELVRDVVKEQQSVLAATLQFITKENMIDEYLGAMRAAGIEDGFGVRGKDVLAMLSEEE